MPPYRTIPSPEEPIGRVMDKLYQLDVSGIFLLISLAAVKKFGVATENCHLDSTSLSVEGEYKKEYPTVEILKSGAVGEEIETRQQPIKRQFKNETHQPQELTKKGSSGTV